MPRPAWHRPRSEARRSQCVFPRWCGRPGRPVQPTRASPAPVRAGVLRDVAQRIAARRPERERLTHSHGPVDEFLVRGDQLDLHRVPCQPSQPKKTLDRGDPTATNNNSKIAHTTSVRLVGRPAIGSLPHGSVQNYVGGPGALNRHQNAQRPAASAGRRALGLAACAAGRVSRRCRRRPSWSESGSAWWPWRSPRGGGRP